MPISKEVLDEIALSQAEYEAIVERLGREPNRLELGMFGALWSEHCGYKHSKPLLRLFPSESPHLLVPPGQENAGVVDIGDGLVIVMKIESHNHPSAVEPFQGAATGVGGIVRDIFAMGARPIALLNSLRFGPLTDPHSRHLFHGVVGGISWYGNCIGVPDVGGEVSFSPSYADNPLVNALCVGLVEQDGLVLAQARGEGNLLMLIGADTGRDGIHGASGLASRTFEEERELRPTVQVGNPFLEKVLIEACLELARGGLLVGMQDLGAAGLTSSAVECAARGGGGVELDIARVPRREAGMDAYEVMLSESQERMLLIVLPNHEEPVRAICDKWDLQATVIGHVTAGGMARVFDGDQEVATLPVGLLTDPPLYRLQGKPAPELAALNAFDFDALLLPKDGPGAILLRLLASPNIASKRWVYRQYDHQVQTNTVLAPGGDAALLRVPGTAKGIALTTDGNGRLCYLDAFVGGAIAVAEACRNLACVGATPLALTDCLNFGDPEKPSVYYQLEQAVRGMAEACRALGVPVISGNVSLYNETRGQAVYPTPVVGALGLLEEVAAHVTAGFQREGDTVVLLGGDTVEQPPHTLAGSEYLELIHGQVAGRPEIDLALETRVQECCRRAVEQRLLSSAHDCSDGGLGVALAECCILGGLGLRGEALLPRRWDAALFGEAQSRILVSLPPERLPQLEALVQELHVLLLQLGTVGGDRITLPALLNVSVWDARQAYDTGLETAIGG